MESSRYTTKRFVLEAPAGEAEVEAWATALGWSRESEIPGDPQRGIEHQIIWSARDVAAIHFLQDTYYGYPYYVLTGGLERIVEALAAQAEADLRPFTIEELCDVHDQAEDVGQRVMSGYLLGIAGSAAYDERVFTRISAALENGDAKAREVALHAIEYADYPEFLPILTRIAQHDSDDGLRARAAAMRDVMASKGTESR
jgi:hypothetical protein